MSNNLMSLSFDVEEEKRRIDFRKFSNTFSTSSISATVKNGVITSGFYRDKSERLKKSGRESHKGIDVTLARGGDGSYDDIRRGVEVYIAIKPDLSIADLNSVRAYDKEKKKKLTGLGIDGTGNAELEGGLIRTQSWKSTAPDSYGGVLGVACYYRYNRKDGATAYFTLYVEYLHLITEEFLPRNKALKIASLEEWRETGKPYGFGPHIVNNAKWSRESFLGPGYILAGYLGATPFPHVHIQAAYEPGKVKSAEKLRFDPELIIL